MCGCQSAQLPGSPQDTHSPEQGHLTPAQLRGQGGSPRHTRGSHERSPQQLAFSMGCIEVGTCPLPTPEESLRPSTGAGRGFGGHSAVWNSGSRQNGHEAPCLPRTPKNSSQTVRPQALTTTGHAYTRSRARGPRVSGLAWCSGFGEPRGRSLQQAPHHWRLPHGLSSTVLSLTSRSPSHSPLGTRKELKQEPPSFTGGDTSAAHPHLTRPPAARLHPALPRALSPPQHLCWETGSSDCCLAIGGGLTSVILIVLSTVSPQLQGWFVPVSLRPALQTVPAYVTAAVCSSRS